MFLPPEEGDEPLMEDSEEMQATARKSLQMKLGESIQSLLDAKMDLTFTLADAVRLMVQDSGSLLFQSSPPGQVGKISEEEKLQLEENILKLEGELNALKTHLRQTDNQRREALNKLLDLKGNIRVFCRMRPFLVNEKRARPGPMVFPQSDMVVIKGRGKTKEYRFDKVFPQEASQDDVFVEVEPILRSALDGHNVCIFAYGQTGTGKTYTMEGSPDSPGIISRTIGELFRQATMDSTLTFTFTFSMLEVYMGCLKDLLAYRPTRLTDPSPKGLSIQMDAYGAVEVENLKEVVVTDFSQALQWYQFGSQARSTAWTNANEASSRSHCLIRVVISCSVHEDGSTKTSKLWMVDLGGSERLLKTHASGQTMDEGKAINLSLSALGDVISALQRKQSHVPYRNSKLTQILRDSLGPDSKTIMLVHINPKEEDLAETICSLNFATRARRIQLGRELSHEAKEHRAAVMNTIILHMRHLEDECQTVRNNLKTVHFLLREKKKLIAKSNLSSEDPELPQASFSQEEFGIDIESLDSCRLAERSLGSKVPGFMAPTASSRLRGRPQDTNCVSPGKEGKREKGNTRRESLPTQVRTMTSCSKPSTIAHSQSEKEWNPSKGRMLKQSPMPNNKKAARFVSKQCTITESQCPSESSTIMEDINLLKCSSMPNNRRITASLFSKQLYRTNKSKVSPGSSISAVIRQSSTTNTRTVSGSKKCTTLDDKIVPQGHIQKGVRCSSMPNNTSIPGPHSKQLTSDELVQSASDSCNPTSNNSDQRSSPVPDVQKQALSSKITLLNKQSTNTNSFVKRQEEVEAGNAHNPKQNSSKSPAPLSLKTQRKSFGDVYKHEATTEATETETTKATSAGDFHSRKTTNNKRLMSLECRIPFNRKL